MEVREKIIFDYTNAKENNHRLLRFALEDLISLTKTKLNQSELLDAIETLIDKKGKKIINKAKKRKNIESDVFQMIIFNSYICNFRFDGKHRPILLEYIKGQDFGHDWDRKLQAPPKTILSKRGFFKNIF